MSETVYGTKLIILAGQNGAMLHRNNNGAHRTASGRWVWYGLGATSASIGSSDYIGGIMVQTCFGRIDAFVAIEMKKPGWKKPIDDREIRQERFIKSVIFRGGFGTFCIASEAGIQECIGKMMEFRRRLEHGGQAISADVDQRCKRYC